MKTMKDNTLIFAFTKIATYAVAPVEEIFILSSKNILTETDPTKVVWDMWPHGEHGIGAVNDFDSPTIITEEPHVLPIFNDDILYVVWRTNQGYMGPPFLYRTITLKPSIHFPKVKMVPVTYKLCGK